MFSFAGTAQEAGAGGRSGAAGTKITIYRKPTHTDQYLNFSSNHPLEHKRSVVRTLTHRAKEFVTTSEDQECELKHVHNALRTNGYTEWALVIPNQKGKTRPTSTNKGNTRPPSIGLPYVQGLSERLSKTFRQHSVSVYHKPVSTLRSILVHPKDKTPKDKKCGVINEITCDQDPAHVKANAHLENASRNTPTWPYQPVLVTTAMPPDTLFHLTTPKC